MLATINYSDFFPQIFPEQMSGKISYKIRQKKDYKRSDGSCALYVYVYQNRVSKKINLDLAVPIKDFDSKKQRVKSSYKFAADYNLVIEKVLSDINSIEINYRLNNEQLNLDDLIENLTNPSLRVDFIKFYSSHLEYQHEKNLILNTTYKQQKSTLEKLKAFKNPLLFADIDENFLLEWKAWLKNHKKNKPATVEIATKNFKKYLHIANEKGIKTQLTFNKIKIKDVKGTITFLMPEEVKRLYTYYHSEFIHKTWKHILQRYLFSCFTGLRISDVERIGPENFVDDVLVFTAHKTGKMQRIKLNKTALGLVEFPQIFNGNYAEQTINSELKLIAKACNINKRLYFHSARHTFATNYLIAGGQIRNLQKILGHSKLATTEKYAHVVDSLMNKEIGLLDGIVN